MSATTIQDIFKTLADMHRTCISTLEYEDKYIEALSQAEDLGLQNTDFIRVLSVVYAACLNQHVFEERKPHSDNVYFIKSEATSLIKIGYSKNPEKRLIQLSKQSADKMRLICVISGDLKKESELHRLFKDERDHGEWFRESQRLLQFISDNGGES